MIVFGDGERVVGDGFCDWMFNNKVV